MSLTPKPLQEHLAAARAGSREALGEVLSQYHFYLLEIARRELGHDLLPKGGASDIVQETFLEAQRSFARFAGHSDAELRAWLRRLLLHRTAKLGRRFRATHKRRLAREVSLDAPAAPAAAANRLAAAAQPTPSAHLMAAERQDVLRRALDRLPDDYRTVMLLRYQQGMTFDEIGRDMRRSGDAVRMLWSRALERLKHELRSFREAV